MFAHRSPTVEKRKPYTPQTKVIGFGGSPRKNGNSDVLLKSIFAGVKELKVPVHGVHLRDYHFCGCIGCEKCRKDTICTGVNDGMTLLYCPIIASRGLVLVSPTHNYNVTAWIKAFIDRLYCFYEFDDQRPRGWSSRLAGQGRKAVIAAVCEQPSKKDMGFTLEAMRLPLEALGYEIVGELAVFGIFDRGKVNEHADELKKAKKRGTQLARALLDAAST
jgi:multimeric flavodoxin WrbA